MQTVMTGNMLMKSPSRMAGTYQIAFAVTTPSGKTGTALFVYEFDKRDVMEETLYTTEEIANEVREYVGEDGPSVFGSFAFPDEKDENTNIDKVTEAIEKATTVVYGFDA